MKFLKLQQFLNRAFAKFLDITERAGNALPHPATLFALLSILVIILSGIAALFDLTVSHPSTGKPIHPVSLLSVSGLHRILKEMVTNFTDFAPLGTVFVSMLGIGLAESSGLISAGLKLLVISAPKRLLTFVIVIAGVLSNMASEIGYVLLVPLAAIIFISVNRHPLAGLAAAFAGVSGGYSANLLLGTIDPLRASISEEADRLVIPGYEVNPASNYYFMAVSTFFVAFAGTWVTDRLVEPRLGNYTNDDDSSGEDEDMQNLSPEEKKGLKYAGVATLILTAIILAGIIPENGYLRELETNSVLRGPFLKGIVAFIFLGSVFVSIAYGRGAGTLKNDTAIMEGMGKAISTLGLYTVLVFFAAQFVSYFNWTNLGLIFAVKGAEALKASGLGSIPLMLSFILLSAVINLFMGSASAKWAIMAPIFIPMFMLLGYTPEFIQVTYRVGDSVTNIIAPMMSYFALIVAFVQRYDKEAGIGTVIALMLPYTVFFLIIWSILLSIWIIFGIPVGPGAGLYIPEGVLVN
jgi:aminobenzoyl-glutamate transport protein